MEPPQPQQEAQPQLQQTIESSNDDEFKLLGLNDDCVREIFEFLELNDLVNVAEMNTRFKVFAQKEIAAKAHMFTLWNFSDECSMVNSKYRVENSKFLGTFGNVMKSLVVLAAESPNDNHFGGSTRFSKDTRTQDRIFRLLNTYRVHGLIDLMLYNFYVTEDTVSLLRPILSNLRRLRIEKSDMCQLMWAELHDMVPELIELELDDVKNTQNVGKSGELGGRYPKLERITLRQVRGVNNWKIEAFVQLNPQLRHIVMEDVGVDANILNLILLHVPAIESVQIKRSFQPTIEWQRL